MLLTIESVGPSKSGKALRVKAGGNWYGANKDSGLAAGMTIEAQVEDGQYGKWIGAYTPKTNGNGHAGQQTSSPSSSSGAGAAAPVWLPFASNTVAHAIQAGHITQPGQVSAWAKAAKEAVEALA